MTNANESWCYSHQRYEPAGDLIDFPCSNLFRDYYYEQGLTPHPSPSYNTPSPLPPAPVAPSPQVLEHLQEQIRALQQQVNSLSQARPRSKGSGPIDINQQRPSS